MKERFLFRFHRSLFVAFAIAGVACGGKNDEGHWDFSFTLRGDPIAADDEADFLLEFPPLLVGSSATRELAVVNSSGSLLEVQIDDGGLAGTPFSVSWGTIQIPPGESRPVELRFAPTTGGDFDATLTFQAGTTGDVRTLRLLGRAAALICDASEVDLGYVVIGQSESETIRCESSLDVPVELALGSFEEASGPGFSASFVGRGGRVIVSPGDSVDIEISFAAVYPPGAASAKLPILDGLGNELLRIGAEAVAVESALELLQVDSQGNRTPVGGCLEFWYGGRKVNKTLIVRNLARRALELHELALDGDASHFVLTPPTLDAPVTLHSGDELEVVLRYEPQEAAAHQASLRLAATAEDGTPEGRVHCVRGWSDAPYLTCEPEALDFGPVMLGTTVRQSFQCSVGMVGIEEDPTKVVMVGDVHTSDLQFVPVIRSEKILHDYAVGESFIVDVDYSPASASAHAATITVENTTYGAPHLPIQVQGEGVNLAPCAFELGPETLDFGVVEPGEERTLTAYLVNTSTQHACIVSNLHLSEESDPVFEMEPVTSAILPPAPPAGAPPHEATTSHRFPLRVKFAPTEARDYAGSVEFFLSHPQQPLQSVALTGRGGNACVFVDVEQEELVSAGICASQATRLSIANFCAEDVSVMSISMDAAYPQFGLEGLPTLPALLEEGERLEFAVTLEPDLHGTFHGAVRVDLLRDGAPELLVVPLSGSNEAENHTDRFEPRKIDVLWVMDNSGGMTQKQWAIGARAQKFLSAAGGADFQMGVTTTSVAEHMNLACPETGFEEAENGRLVPHPDLGLPRILHSGMSSQAFETAFARNTEVGWCTAYEAVLEAARRALSAPWILTPMEETGNRGFLRKDAALAIIGVTDEGDFDSIWGGDPSADSSVARYVGYFQKRKPSWFGESVKVHMISGGTTSCSSNFGSAGACPRCVEATEQSGGHWVSICQDSAGWDQAIEELSEAVFAPQTRFRLGALPGDENDDGVLDEADFQVRVGGQSVSPRTPQGAEIWSYDATANSIVFSPLYAPGSDEPVEVGYRVACAP